MAHRVLATRTIATRKRDARHDSPPKREAPSGFVPIQVTLIQDRGAMGVMDVDAVEVELERQKDSSEANDESIQHPRIQEMSWTDIYCGFKQIAAYTCVLCIILCVLVVVLTGHNTAKDSGGTSEGPGGSMWRPPSPVPVPPGPVPPVPQPPSPTDSGNSTNVTLSSNSTNVTLTTSSNGTNDTGR